MSFDITELAFLTLMGGYLVASPYTKVEESFNVQAIHDMVKYGFFDVQKYDHNEFPGAVPRSFIGAAFVSIFTKIVGRYVPPEDPFFYQIIARGILGAFNAFSLFGLRKSINWALSVNFDPETFKTSVSEKKKQTPEYRARAEGLSRAKLISTWFFVLLLIQFHIPYYMSRTLPNFFAFPLTNLAFSYIFSYSFGPALAVFAFTAITLRSEVALLLGTVTTVLVLRKRISIKKAATYILAGAAAGFFLSVTIDSFYWQKPLMVPEINSFIFNVVDGKSSDWGTSPPWEYFSDVIPRLLNFGGAGVYLFVVLGLFGKDDTPFSMVGNIGVASILYVLAYSALPHKEFRFIVYVMPIFTLLTAVGIASISDALKKRIGKVAHYGFQLTMVQFALLSFVITWGRLFISVNNYPGGNALGRLHDFIPMTHNPIIGEPIVVHFDVPVAMTGATRFGQVYEDDGSGTGAGRKLEYEPWVIYDKTEDQEELNDIADSFDYLVVSIPPDFIEDVFQSAPDSKWKVLDTVQSVTGYNAQKAIQLSKDIISQPGDYFDWVVELFEIAISKKVKREGEDGEPPVYTDAWDSLDIAYKSLSSYVRTVNSVWIYKRVPLTDPIENPTELPWDFEEGAVTETEEATTEETVVHDEL